jgi:predicted transcriptional regulator
MKAYVDLEKIMTKPLFNLLMDIRQNPTSLIQDRAKRLSRSCVTMTIQHRKLLKMGLIRRVGVGKYINTLQSKVNDPVEQLLINAHVPRKAKRTKIIL